VKNTPDVVLVGGGLANSFIAWRLKTLRPELRLLVLERGPALGGRHTWSHFASDVEPEQAAWLEPLIAHRWPSYDVAFPGRRRRLDIPYASTTSERLHAVIAPVLGDAVRYDADVVEVGPDHVRLAGEDPVSAPLVIDGRGPVDAADLVLGWQKFLGCEVEIAEPHGMTAPIVMDATVSQHDGYRFVYTLPLGPDRLMIEDTYYSDGPQLDRAALRSRIGAYGHAKGWRIRRTRQEEDGVLPIALAGDIDAFWRAAGPTPRSGLRAALFHPTTGYSLPDAARLADHIAGMRDLTSPAVQAGVEAMSKALWRERRFFRLLNRMMFGAGAPSARYRILERFYGLPQPLIERFYRGRLTWADRARLLAGKPPVPVLSAIGCLPEQGFRLKEAR
jgi:lycopene beta-cyclase